MTRRYGRLGESFRRGERDGGPANAAFLHVVTWLTFVEQQPDMAAEGKSLLYQHGVGLAFLATTDKTDALAFIRCVRSLRTMDCLHSSFLRQSRSTSNKGARTRCTPFRARRTKTRSMTGHAELVTDSAPRCARSTVRHRTIAAESRHRHRKICCSSSISTPAS